MTTRDELNARRYEVLTALDAMRNDEMEGPAWKAGVAELVAIKAALVEMGAE